MSRRFPLEVAAACLMILTAARLASAQAAPQAPADQPAATQSTLDIVIPDEPRTIDPATLVPQRLAQPATVQFDNASLNEVVQWLRDDQKINTIADSKRLQDAGISLGEPITDSLNNEPLYLLLNRLRVVGVTWSYRDDILRLHPASDLDELLTTASYVVGDIFDAGSSNTDLIRALQGGSGIHWEDIDGTGGSLQALGDVLFVRQSELGQRRVAGMLAALRQHGRRTFTYDEPQHFAIREKLKAHVSLNVQDAPLVDVLAEIAQQAGVEIRIDTAAFREQRVRDREPVSVTLTDQPLHIVLQAVLAPLKLDWVLQDGLLWATSQEAASETLKTAVFDVRDLCRDRSESSALHSAVLNYTDGPWEDIDGNGGTIVFARPGTMVVDQTESQLDSILQLLENYRLALRNSKRRAKQGESPTDVITRYYRMQASVAAELRTTLPQLVEPETWRDAEHQDRPGTIRQLTAGTSMVGAATAAEFAVLVIQQSRATHTKIAELVKRIESGDPLNEPAPAPAAPMGGGMGGMGGGMGGFGGGYFSTPQPQPQKP